MHWWHYSNMKRQCPSVPPASSSSSVQCSAVSALLATSSAVRALAYESLCVCLSARTGHAVHKVLYSNVRLYCMKQRSHWSLSVAAVCGGASKLMSVRRRCNEAVLCVRTSHAVSVEWSLHADHHWPLVDHWLSAHMIYASLLVQPMCNFHVKFTFLYDVFTLKL